MSPTCIENPEERPKDSLATPRYDRCSLGHDLYLLAEAYTTTVEPGCYIVAEAKE